MARLLLFLVVGFTAASNSSSSGACSSSSSSGECIASGESLESESLESTLDRLLAVADPTPSEPLPLPNEFSYGPSEPESGDFFHGNPSDQFHLTMDELFREASRFRDHWECSRGIFYYDWNRNAFVCTSSLRPAARLILHWDGRRESITVLERHAFAWMWDGSVEAGSVENEENETFGI